MVLPYDRAALFFGDWRLERSLGNRPATVLVDVLRLIYFKMKGI